MTLRVGLIGIGLMGAHMGRNLLQAGFPLAVWNRTAEKAQALVAQGAELAASPAAAAEESDVVITMLSDGPAVATVMDQTKLALGRGMIWVDMSSTKPSEARAQRTLLDNLGVGHLDAPVSGGTKGAEGGTLAIMAGGEADVFAQAEPVLQAMGRPVHVGPTGSGQLAKLANQAIVAVTIGAVAEAMLMIQKGGGDPAAVRDALKGGFADSTILQQHGARMTDGNFEPGGLTYNQVKDLDNALEEARSLGLTLPTTEEIRARFIRLRDVMGGAELDHSALYLELLKRNGLSPS